MAPSNASSVQRQSFKDQLIVQDKDPEVQHFNAEFCEALEYGLPPTAGWGCGIDRLTMFLAQESSIKEVILFPLVKRGDTVPEAQSSFA